MKFKRILSTLMACAVVLGVSVVPTDKTVLTANAATNSYSFTPEYRQTEARGMLSLVNSFRTGSLSASTVFNLWKEDNDDYSGQGHRRNMLSSNFTSIGIAHVYYNGCHYWVQEFSSKVGSSVKSGLFFYA